MIFFQSIHFWFYWFSVCCFYPLFSALSFLFPSSPWEWWCWLPILSSVIRYKVGLLIWDLLKSHGRRAWWAVVHGVPKSRTQLSDFTFTFHFHALQKEMVTHSSVLAWRIPGMGEPRGLPSMGLHRVRHDWSDLAAAAALLYGFPWHMGQCSVVTWGVIIVFHMSFIFMSTFCLLVYIILKWDTGISNYCYLFFPSFLFCFIYFGSFNKLWENTDLSRQKDKTLFQSRDHTLDANVSTSLGFPGGSDGKESACNVGDLGSIPGLGRFPGGGHATHSSILAWRIPMDRGAW